MRKTRSKLAVAAAVGLVAAGGSAFTAANTDTPLTSAGQAATTTTGFAVSNVDYVLAAVAPATGDQLASVTFTLTASPGQNIAEEARVQLVATAAYYTCTISGSAGQAVDFSCATAGLAVNAINTLDIVAVSDTTP